MKEITDISNFTPDKKFYGEIELLITVKSFDLQSIRKRYLESKKNTSASGKTGSVERRNAAEGGVLKIIIRNGKIIHQEILAKLKEPRGIACSKSMLGIAAENTIYLIDKNHTQELKNEWFSYIHTINFSPVKSDHLLISSSGFDCIFEYHIKSQQKTYEWFAWENGFNKATDPKTGENILLTRNAKTAEQHIRSGNRTKLIDNPANDILPTAMRAAFINTAQYDLQENNTILATFFHEGIVYKIDKDSGKSKAILTGLKNPHGGCNFQDKYMVTSTGSGEVILGNEEHQQVYDFKNLPGKPPYLNKNEWLQNSITLEKNIITIDSNRNSFIIFNPENQLIDKISYDENWAIQDLILTAGSTEQEERVKMISS